MLNKGLESLAEGEKPLLHSDQGWHYRIKSYQSALADKGLVQSMSRRGNRLDNAVMENFFGQPERRNVLSPGLQKCRRAGKCR